MAAAIKVHVDKKSFVHMYEHLDYTSGFYILSNAPFDKSLAFSSCCISAEWSAENFDVDSWFKPIKYEELELQEGGDCSSKEKDTENQKIDLSSNEFQDLLANLNSCFEEENLRILDTKLIGNEKITEKEELIVTGLGRHMIQKLIDLSSNEFQDLLANLNSCLEEENFRILDTKLIGNEKIAVKEELIVTGLGLHMIQKLVGKAQVCSSKPDQSCPCASLEPRGVCPERVPLSEGLMYIGSRQTWHGELDLCASGVGIIAARLGPSGDSNMTDDDCEECHGERTNQEFKCGENFNWKAHSQAIAQAIVYGFTEFNRHKDLSSLIPTVLLNHECFLVLIYDPKTDSLMGPRKPVYYINRTIKDKTDPRRYLGIFFLWLILNHRYFFSKTVRNVQTVACKFRKKTERKEKFHEYEKLQEFKPPFKVTDQQSILESPGNLVLNTNKRKRDWNSE